MINRYAYNQYGYKKRKDKDWEVEASYKGKSYYVGCTSYYIENGNIFVILDTDIKLSKREKKIIKEKLLSIEEKE